MEPLNTTVTVEQLPPNSSKKVANITLMDARFFGRPNFLGEEDRFKDSSRKFTVMIPNEDADNLRSLGWNIKTLIPTPEQLAEDPTREPISILKVKLNFGKAKEDPTVETGPDIYIKMGEELEKLTSKTVGILDRSRVLEMSMEIRAWNYNKEEVEAGIEEPEYSARLVQLVAVIQPSMLEQRYGPLR